MWNKKYTEVRLYTILYFKQATSTKHLRKPKFIIYLPTNTKSCSLMSELKVYSLFKLVATCSNMSVYDWCLIFHMNMCVKFILLWKSFGQAP